MDHAYIPTVGHALALAHHSQERAEKYIAERDYETLEFIVLEHLMGG